MDLEWQMMLCMFIGFIPGFSLLALAYLFGTADLNHDD